jgi:hypothetical protein
VVLEAPGFAAADLAVTEGGGPAGAGTVRVTTGYTDGSPTHARDVPAGAGDVLLSPGDLGLAEVTVDGRPLARDGGVTAEVLLTYRPRNGRERHHTLRLGGGSWIAHRWLVVPPGAAPAVEYGWTATTADGRTERQARARSETGNIVLSFSGGTGNVADRQSPNH